MTDNVAVATAAANLMPTASDTLAIAPTPAESAAPAPLMPPPAAAQAAAIAGAATPPVTTTAATEATAAKSMPRPIPVQPIAPKALPRQML